MELNLEQPIFVVYVNTEGLSRQMESENLKSYTDYYGQYTNATFWILPTNETKVELIWNGSKYKINGDYKIEHMQNLIEHVNNVLKIISDGTSEESIRAQLRDLQLSKILD